MINLYSRISVRQSTKLMMSAKEISIAPMLDLTNRHCRYLHRLLSKNILLYSEMVVAGAILYGDQSRFLTHSDVEHPLALQLAGNKPDELAKAAEIAADWGYDEINLNVGCPSSRVSAGGFGACLMLQPDLVVECVAAMVACTKVPISVKTRLGVQGETDFYDLLSLVARLEQVGCRKVIIHAREAKLTGMNPKQNRCLLSLNYDLVAAVKMEFPALTIIVNGGLANYQQIDGCLSEVDGVMIGLEAYRNPYLLANIDQRYFASSEYVPTREQITVEYLDYVDIEVAKGNKPLGLLKPLLGLYKGCSGARAWRKKLLNSSFYRHISA